MKSSFGLVAVLALAGCANPSIVRVKADAIRSADVQNVYVPRFEGSPDFVEESTDMFIAELESRVSANIIQGPALRRESTDVHSGGNLAPAELAIEAAKQAGAEAVIMGKVTSHKTDVTLNGFATVRVISVSDGSTLASFHRPSGSLVANSEHQSVMSAVQRVAKDVAAALE